MRNPVGKRNYGGHMVAIAFIVVSAGFLAWSYAYSPVVRTVPLLIGWTTLALAAIDFVLGLRNGGRLGEKPRTDGSAGVEPRADGNAGEEGALPFYKGREVRALGWLLGLVAGIYLVGYLVITPIFVSVSLVRRGKIGWSRAGFAAAVVSIGIWFFFSRVMNYELYRGILLEPFY